MSITGRKYQSPTKHEAFPIADFSQALFLAREPWRSPENAFRTVQNARAFRGQIVKRGGYSMFAEIGRTSNSAAVIPSSDPTIGGVVYLLYDTQGPQTDRPIAASVRFVADIGTAHANEYAYLANLRWASTIPIVGTVVDGWIWDVVDSSNVVIGVAKLDPTLPAAVQRFQAWIDWTSHTNYVVAPAGTTVFEYTPNPETEIVGLFRFTTKGNDYFIACDPDYVYLYDLTARYYKDQGFAATGFAGPFTGSNTDYFWYQQVDDYVVMTNNVDPVCKWDPALPTADSVKEMPTDWVTPGTNELDTARIVVMFRGRLIYINTVENTTRYNTRMRWTAAGTATGWRSPSDYSDAPKDLGDAIDAKFIGERCFVAFEKGWMEIVRRPGDDQLAFEWAPVISRFGAVSSFATVRDNERLISRSDTTMQSIDPNGQTYIDVQIPDLLLSLSTRYRAYCTAIRSELDRSLLWTTVSRAAAKPDGALVAVYDEENKLSWSQYVFPFNYFSTFDKQDAKTWNQLGPSTWNYYAGQTWNQLGAGSQGTESLIGGQSRGTIYQFDSRINDNNISSPQTISVVLETEKLMPIPGRRSHFGWLDIFADVQDACPFRISFYADEDVAPYFVRDVTITPASAAGKAYARVSVQRSAMLHRFKIESLDDTPFAFDAFVPWFRDGGRVRPF